MLHALRGVTKEKFDEQMSVVLNVLYICGFVQDLLKFTNNLQE